MPESPLPAPAGPNDSGISGLAVGKSRRAADGHFCWSVLRPFVTSNGVKVRLTPQGRELEIQRVKRVADLLAHLEIAPGTVLVIRGDSLLTDDARLFRTDEIELRSVVSGG